MCFGVLESIGSSFVKWFKLFFRLSSLSIPETVDLLTQFNLGYYLMLGISIYDLYLDSQRRNSYYHEEWNHPYELITTCILIVLYIIHILLMRRVWISELPNLRVIRFIMFNVCLTCVLYLSYILYTIVYKMYWLMIGAIVNGIALFISVYIMYHLTLKVFAAEDRAETEKLIDVDEFHISYLDPFIAQEKRHSNELE